MKKPLTAECVPTNKSALQIASDTIADLTDTVARLRETMALYKRAEQRLLRKHSSVEAVFNDYVGSLKRQVEDLRSLLFERTAELAISRGKEKA